MRILTIRRILLYLFALVFSINILSGQSVTLRQVVLPTQGAHYKIGNTALSWTLGEPAQNSIGNSGVLLTQGMQQIEKPLAMDSIPPKRACSDTTQQIVFRNVTAGKWASHVEWATNSSFTGSHFIINRDSIALTVDSAMVDTIWLRGAVGYRGPKGPVTKTQASVLPNISVANKIAVVNDLCGVIDTIHLAGPSYTGGYTYQWQSSSDGLDFSDISMSINSDHYLIEKQSVWIWFRRLLYQEQKCEKISNTVSVK